jgi:UDPglucose 6-dehydrogenase
MSNIGIIGWGVVGQATGQAFLDVGYKVFWNDPALKGSTPLPKLIKSSDFIFICVPTPMFSDESDVDLSIVNQVVKQIAPKIANTNKVLIIKSTIPPGTTSSFAQRFPKTNFAMSPEFLTEINAPWDFLHPDRVVIGAFSEAVAINIAKLHRAILGYEVKIFITDPTTAELTKYMSNTFMATKIIFANEMFALAKKLDINYDDVREMVAADKRIGPSFLKVTPFRGFGGKCFAKDTVALLGSAKKLRVDLSVLQAAWQKNLKIRKIRDWETINGAVSKKKK